MCSCVRACVCVCVWPCAMAYQSCARYLGDKTDDVEWSVRCFWAKWDNPPGLLLLPNADCLVCAALQGVGALAPRQLGADSSEGSDRDLYPAHKVGSCRGLSRESLRRVVHFLSKSADQSPNQPGQKLVVWQPDTALPAHMHW